MKRLLDQLEIPSYFWAGEFTANSKMVESYRLLNETIPHDKSTFIYHTDVDELSDVKQLKTGIDYFACQVCSILFDFKMNSLYLPFNRYVLIIFVCIFMV